jgi:hypothetical protein
MRNQMPSRPTSSDVFDAAFAIVARSQVVEVIDGFHAETHPHGATGRSPSPYTMRGVIVALMSLALLAGNRLQSDVFRVLCDFTPEQAQRCGINYAGLAEPRRGSDYKRWEARFREWLNARLRCFDPDPDLPAERRTNAEDAAVRRARSEEDWEHHDRAERRRDVVANLIVAGSIPQRIKELVTGADLVTDETIIDLVKHMWGIGAGPDKLRGASPFGKTYRRDKHRAKILNIDDAKLATLSTSAPTISKSGFGTGVTALAVVGPYHDIYRYPQVVTAIGLNEPHGASLDGLLRAIDAHKSAGFDQRSGPRARLRHITYDNGYTNLDGCNEALLERGYAAVFRYPEHWLTNEASVPTLGANGTIEPGPIQVAGTWYCPAVRDHDVDRDLVRSGELLLRTSGYDAHDRRLRALLPFTMGVHSRPFRAYPNGGRPAGGAAPEKVWKQQLVCPAALGRVRCLFQNNPTVAPELSMPTATPTWQRSEYACCANATVTVTFTERQLKRAQFGRFVAGSWEHLTYYEACRSATERLFSRLKSQSGAGLAHLHEGARREPFVTLIIATAFAAANHWAIERFESQPKPPNPAKRKQRILTADLQRTPTATPPRS